MNAQNENKNSNSYITIEIDCISNLEKGWSITKFNPSENKNKKVNIIGILGGNYKGKSFLLEMLTKGAIKKIQNSKKELIHKYSEDLQEYQKLFESLKNINKS